MKSKKNIIVEQELLYYRNTSLTLATALDSIDAKVKTLPIKPSIVWIIKNRALLIEVFTFILETIARLKKSNENNTKS
jgi:hypothetical protein